MRRGQRRRTLGQGASRFELSGDSVAAVPVTVRKLQLTADQGPLEQAGV